MKRGGKSVGIIYYLLGCIEYILVYSNCFCWRLQLAQNSDIQMALDLFELETRDLIDNIELGGATTYMENALKSDINLYI